MHSKRKTRSSTVNILELPLFADPNDERDALMRGMETEGPVHAFSGGASKSAISKSAKPTRAATTRRRKKLQAALLKKVDARDSEEALAEQVDLLGADSDNTSKPCHFGRETAPSPTEVTPPKTKSRTRRGAAANKKYVEDIVLEDCGLGDELQRAKRWIPDFEHRKRLTKQPAGVPYGLWMSYKFLDEFIYRHSLSAEEVAALPLLDDVHEFQNSDGKTPMPMVPSGYQFDENLELVPVKEEL
ncbi:hypothetical protein F4808DRAFT_473744 [Astrocystis sublimbata]|nr:hypothetical protein F4808DRAFT_473744 [Astrocystis sublimbata]